MDTKPIAYSIAVLAIFCFQCLLLACSADDEKQAVASTSIQLSFTLATDENLTRTYWGEDVSLKAQQAFEDHIEKDKIQVLVYDSSNTLIGQLQNLICLNGDGTDTDIAENVCKVIGTLQADAAVNINSFSGKVVILANYDAPVSGADVERDATLSNISANQFAFDDAAIKARTKYIPMWGIHSFSGIRLQANRCVDIGTVNMLRAMAKIRLRLSTEKNSDGEIVADDYEMSSVYLDHYATNGYTVPNGFDDTSNYSGGTFDTENLLTLNSFKGGDVAEEQLYFEEDTTGQSFYVYLPEYPMGGTVPKINFTLNRLKDKETKSFIVELKAYDSGYATGAGIEILRNTIYQYSITKINGLEKVPLTIKYQVQKWNTRSSEIIFD